MQRIRIPCPPAGRHMAVHLWGAQSGVPLVCVHGLTRNARDFDALARALAPRRRVVCPDVAGRGHSDWLENAAAYGYPTYVADMTALVATLGAPRVDWLGTSMGGLVGMLLAALPDTPVARLVLNDVGPHIPAAALRRIAAYVGKDPSFASVAELETYLRQVHASFGPLSNAQWQHLAVHSARWDGERFRLAYDPAIALAFQESIDDDVLLWDVWENIRCPVLLLHGAQSDLLLAPTVQRMVETGPEVTLREFSGIGHAPALMAEDQIRVVEDWLEN